MRTVLELLNLSTDYLRKRRIEHARRQAEELLGEALQTGRLGLYLQYDRPVTQSEVDLCREWLKRRGEGEPLSYIAGKTEFYTCSLELTPDVLIPRQETEILVDKIVKELSGQPLAGKKLWDVCCGSGCIGIAIKKTLPELTISMSDIWPPAAELARKNAQANEIEVEVLVGDLLDPFIGQKADYIVCNPPYIAESELSELEIEVRDYEPKRALIGGKTGLEFYERLAQVLPGYLNPQGKVWLEIGKGQGEAIKGLFLAPYWHSHKIENDWAGHQRFFSLEIE